MRNKEVLSNTLFMTGMVITSILVILAILLLVFGVPVLILKFIPYTWLAAILLISWLLIILFTLCLGAAITQS